MSLISFLASSYPSSYPLLYRFSVESSFTSLSRKSMVSSMMYFCSVDKDKFSDRYLSSREEYSLTRLDSKS